MKFSIAIISTACLVGSFAVCRADSDETISLSQAPSAVQQAIKSAAGDSTITKIEKGDEDGKVQYEAETKTSNGQKIEFAFNADGSLDSTEETVSLGSLPGDVAGAAKTAVGNGSIKSVEKVTEHGKVTYEVGYKNAKGDELEAVLSPSGKVIPNGPDND